MRKNGSTPTVIGLGSIVVIALFACSLPGHLTATSSSQSPTGAPRLLLVAGGGNGPDGALAVEAELKTPFGVAFDASGNFFIAEFTGHRVRKVDQKGVISTFAGT